MSLCVVVAEDGSGQLTADPSSPNCSQYVLLSSDDYYAMQHSGVLPPLSISDAAMIASAVLFCWVCGWIWGPISEALDT